MVTRNVSVRFNQKLQYWSRLVGKIIQPLMQLIKPKVEIPFTFLKINRENSSSSEFILRTQDRL